MKMIRLEYKSYGNEIKRLETEAAFRGHCATSGLDPQADLAILAIEYACLFQQTGMKIHIADLSNLGQKK